MANSITIFGVVTDDESKPIDTIEVNAFRDGRNVAHGYSNSEGRYWLTVESGEPVVILFDTHETLLNADRWHLSVVLRVPAAQDVEVSRQLVGVGSTGGFEADMEALIAYQLSASLDDISNVKHPKAYCEVAAGRLNSMKFP
jgi:hypothetical protein